MTTNHFAWNTVAPVAALGILVLLLLGAAVAQGQPAEAGVQVLTRGPVHEAFAEASMTGSTAGIVITKAPYDPIAETPPDQRPEGAHVAWIPGYWSYDEDRSDFIWVSGVWRDIPPGRQWVPGYWTPVNGGSQWISGFWGPVAQTEVTYLPPPPEPLEAGPSSPAPAPNNVWTSGSWVWQDTRYDWQPGYWVPQQPDWVWAPAHYIWTPRGYVYVAGYWDHDIIHRGVMFAPVYYDHPVYAQPNYSYSPSIIIDLGVIAASLFVSTRSHHYYYGDYYDQRYEDQGFHPWYSKEARRYGDDPIYTHYRSQQLRQDPAWDTHVQEQFSFRRDHVDARPPQTLALQVNIFNARKADTPENMFIGRTFSEASQRKTDPLHFAAVNADERKQFETRGQEVRKFQVERAKLETAAKPPGKSKEARAVRMQMPVSPVAAKLSDTAEGVKAPPPMPVAPKPQVVEGRTRKEGPQQVEATAGSPQSQEKPGKTEAQPNGTRQKPNRAGPKPNAAKPEGTRSDMTTPQTTQAGPAPSAEKPGRVDSKPRETKPDATPQPVQSKPSTGREKPNRIAPKPGETKPDATPQASKPSTDREKPNRPAPKPAEMKPESAQQPATPQAKPSRQDTLRVKPETNTPTPQNVDRSKTERVNVRPEAKPADRKVQSAPQREMRPQQAQPKEQAPRTETRKQGGKRQQAPDTDNKDKKNE